jgi:hypothetical protein
MLHEHAMMHIPCQHTVLRHEGVLDRYHAGADAPALCEHDADVISSKTRGLCGGNAA